MASGSKMIPVGLAVLMLGFAVLIIPSTLHLSSNVHGTTRTMSLIGNYIYGWNYSQLSGPNPTITVKQGDTINLQLSSGDSVTHRFFIDVDNNSATPDCPGADICSGNFPPSITLPITVNFSPGTYTYYCSIHPGTMVGKFIVQPASPDYSLGSNPTSLTFLKDSSGTSTVTVSSQNGFSGTINLSASVSTTGPTMSLNPTSVTISSGSSKTSTLSVNSTSSTPSGSYTVTITGSNATTSRTTTISVTINAPTSQDFRVGSNPTSLSVASGSTGTTTITLTELGGFSGMVTLTGSVSPSGPTVSFNPSSVTVSGGSATSTMTVSAAGGYYSTVANGNYSVNVTATSGTLSHSTIVQVTVGSTNPGSSLGNIPVTVLIGAVVVIAAAVVVTVFLLRRKAK